MLLAMFKNYGAMPLPIPGGGPMPGGVPVWPGKDPNPGGRPYGDAVEVISFCKHIELK